MQFRTLWAGMICLFLTVFAIGCSDSSDSTEPAGNNPPVAKAGVDKTVDVSTEVTLNGSASSDPDKDSLVFLWTIIQKPQGSVAALVNASTASASFVPDKSGQYVIRLTVSDGSESATDDIVITAQGVAAPTVISGTISTATRLVNVHAASQAVDYILEGHVFVEAQLTIDPGVRIQTMENSHLNIGDGGSISAVGKADSMIVFNGSVATAGHWQGITVSSNNPNNVFDYVEIAHAGGNDYVGIYLHYNGQVQIKHSYFHHNATYGFQSDEEGKINAFVENTFQNNQIAGIYIPSSHIGSIDAASTYAGGNGTDIIKIGANNVEANQSWPKTDAPYQVTGTIFIEAAVTVSPGASFIFTEYAGLTVNENGSLKAVGTAADSIRFRGETSTAGYWYGLIFYSNDPDNILQYVSLSDGGHDDYANVYLMYTSQASISNCTILRSGTSGVYSDDDVLLTAFANNVLGQNHDYPISIPANLIGSIDSGTDYSAANGKNKIHVYGGDVEADASWPAANVPYFVEESVYILSDVTIEAGADFLIGAGINFSVETDGSLKAVGTSENRITFLGNVATQGYWNGISILSNNPSNTFVYSEIGHGGANDYSNFYVYYAGLVTITDCSIHDSANWGIYVESEGSATVADNIYANNAEGDVLFDE